MQEDNEIKKDPIIIYDLDGTLIPFNSFKYWIVFSFMFSVFFLQFSYFFLIIRLTFQRIGKKTDRKLFKELIVKYHFEHQNSFYIKRFNQQFASFLKKKTRFSIIEKNKTLFLATAAPDCYVTYYFQLMGCFSGYTACFFKDTFFFENIGEEKVILLEEKFKEELSFAIFYTDHYDDIPLAKKVKKTYLIYPDKKTSERFVKANVSFDSLNINTFSRGF